MINTVWNDDGEGLFNLDWYGVLFGPVAAWQAGESSIPDYQEAYGPALSRRSTGKINEAEKELMAAEEVLGNAKPELSSDGLFWLDPWSAHGQEVSAKAAARGTGTAPPRRARHRTACPSCARQTRT